VPKQVQQRLCHEDGRKRRKCGNGSQMTMTMIASE
jgi:hypothetical protein